MEPRCSLCPFNGRIKILGERPSCGALLTIVADHADPVSVYEGRPMQGPASTRLRESLEAAGAVWATDIAVVYATACAPKAADDAKDVVRAVSCCRPYVESFVEAAGAPVVLALGASALASACAGETRLERTVGAIVPEMRFGGREIFPAWFPPFVYYQAPHLTPLYEIFLRRVWALATQHYRFAWPRFELEVSEASLEALRRIRGRGDTVGFDCETIPGMGLVTAAGVSDGVDTVSIPWETYDTNKWGQVLGVREYGALGAAIVAEYQAILSRQLVVTQNGAFDVREMRAKGLDFRNGFDTMLAHATRWPQLKHGLEWIALQYYSVPRWKVEFKAYSDVKGSDMWQQRDPLELRTYNARDTLMQRKLYEPTRDALHEIPRGMELFEERMRQADLAARASDLGMLVSRERLQGHRDNITAKMQPNLEAVAAIASGVGIDSFNAASPKHLSKLFFEALRCKPSRYSEATGKPSLDDKTLSDILASNVESETSKQAAKALLRVRMYSKLLSTYVDGLESQLDSESIFHPDFKVHGALTGRWGSFIHTIPHARKEAGETVAPGLRDVFVARPGYYICEADFSQQELRGIALLSGDKPWLDAYATGADIHTQTAQELFGASDKQLRSLAKAFNFATNYCSADLEKAARGVWSVLRVDFPSLELWTVVKMLKKKYKAHPSIAAWRQAQLAAAQRDDYIEEPYSKRRRYFNGRVKETEAYNFPIQALGAYLMGIAMDRVAAAVDWDTHRVIIPNWHDAIYLESRDPSAAAQILRDAMVQTLTYGDHSMTFTIDVAVGKDLGNKIAFEKWLEKEATK